MGGPAVGKVVLAAFFSVLSIGAPAAPPVRSVRATGVVRAVHTVMVQVPRIEGQGGNLTLAQLIENGKVVTPGDSLAIFDRTAEIIRLREAQAKFDDLRHQVEQK